MIERSNEALLGHDETAGRIRRYVTSHQAPADDRAAFESLCVAVFAVGIGFEIVERNLMELKSAFNGFVPAVMARHDEVAAAWQLEEPRLKNRSKILACIAIARRWAEETAQRTYLSRIAQVASSDDPLSGWPELVKLLQNDFPSLDERVSKTILKRWGFFTAEDHRGARRLLARLALIPPQAGESECLRYVSKLAQAANKDPYAIEATLAIFAGAGPCQLQRQCSSCALRVRCPGSS